VNLIVAAFICLELTPVIMKKVGMDGSVKDIHTSRLRLVEQWSTMSLRRGPVALKLHFVEACILTSLACRREKNFLEEIL